MLPFHDCFAVFNSDLFRKHFGHLQQMRLQFTSIDLEKSIKQLLKLTFTKQYIFVEVHLANLPSATKSSSSHHLKELLAAGLIKIYWELRISPANFY